VIGNFTNYILQATGSEEGRRQRIALDRVRPFTLLSRHNENR
jgi:hypothetical protein